MRIAFAGNPNSGKTTMYNALTGRNEKVGNWAGVTVDKKEAPIKKAYAGEKEAEANKEIAASLSKELIEYKTIEQWDGKLPSFVGGEGSIPVLNFGNSSNVTE